MPKVTAGEVVLTLLPFLGWPMLPERREQGLRWFVYKQARPQHLKPLDRCDNNLRRMPHKVRFELLGESSSKHFVFFASDALRFATASSLITW